MLQKENSNHAFQRVLLYLSTPKMRDNFIGKDDLFDLLEIPKEIRVEVYNKLWFGPKYIDGKMAVRNPQIKINGKGIEYAEQLREEMFQATGKNVDYRASNNPLSETFELIYKKHKDNSGTLVWHKNTFDPFWPENLYVAKETMLNKNVLFTHSSNPKITLLNTDIIECATYEEAIKNLSMSNSVKNNSSTITIGGDFKGNLNNQSIQSAEHKESSDHNDGVKRKKMDWIKIIGIISAIAAGIISVLKALKVI